MMLDGSCACGAVTYECAAEPAFTAICHCKACQRQTGTYASLVVGVDDSRLNVSGDALKTFVTTADSGFQTYRSFCGNCGSPIVSRCESIEGLAFIKAGTLHDTGSLQPNMEFWVEEAQAWTSRLADAQCFQRGT